jgi:hypothetical protein
LIALVAVLSSCAITSARTDADVYEGILHVPPPAQPRSHAGERPIEQRNLYRRLLSLRYDSQAGSVTVVFGFYEPEYWAQRLNGTTEYEGTPGTVPRTLYTESGVLFAASSSCERNDVSAKPGEGVRGEVTPTQGAIEPAGYTGVISGLTAYSAGNYSVTFLHPALVGLQLTCLEVLWKVPSRDATEIVLLKDLSSKPPTPVAAPPNGITAHRATRAQLAAMRKAANARHPGGYSVRTQYLASPRVTSNGWAEAVPRFKRPSVHHHHEHVIIVFRLVRGHWRVITWGPAVCSAGQRRVPTAVCRALSL